MLRLCQIMPMVWSRWLFFRCDKPCTCKYTCTQRFCYSAVAHILTSSVNLAFELKLGFKNKCRAWAGFGLVISSSGRVQASKWGPFTTLCGYVCREQQGEIERILLQPLRWCCVKCAIHHERVVREEQHHTYMWREQAIIEWSWHVNSIVACCHSAKLCAYAARDFLSQQYILHPPALKIDWNHFVK